MRKDRESGDKYWMLWDRPRGIVPKMPYQRTPEDYAMMRERRGKIKKMMCETRDRWLAQMQEMQRERMEARAKIKAEIRERRNARRRSGS
jgi:hypothetical protein